MGVIECDGIEWNDRTDTTRLELTFILLLLRRCCAAVALLLLGFGVARM